MRVPEPTPAYRHTQIGWIMLLAVFGGVLAAAVAGLAAHRPIIFLPIALLVGISLVFSRFTIEIRDGELQHHFALGFWRRRVPLADIADVRRSTTSWWEGWGIRVTTRGMLYNVAGRDAVEIRRRSGRAFRLGTDEPDALLAALLAALRAAGVPAA